MSPDDGWVAIEKSKSSRACPSLCWKNLSKHMLCFQRVKKYDFHWNHACVALWSASDFAKSTATPQQCQE
jgi:hypothetical protein